MNADERDGNAACGHAAVRRARAGRSDGVLTARNPAHFGAAAAPYESWEYADSAARAIDQPETQPDLWTAGLRSLDDSGLRAPIGAKEPFPEAPLAGLAPHIHRELVHHLSEVCLLRDLHTHPATNGAVR